MNENDIRKALDWCEQFENNLVFKGNGDKKCALALQMMVVIKHALKNYNRQKAEIEVQERTIKNLQAAVREVNQYFDEKVAEAIKEFAERLKAENIYGHQGLISAMDVDALVSEMVGERE